MRPPAAPSVPARESRTVKDRSHRPLSPALARAMYRWRTPWRGSSPWSTAARSAIGVSVISMSRTWRNSSSLAGGDAVATDQVLFNLTRRGIERELLPWCRARPQRIPIMAYSPIEQGRLLEHRAIRAVAARHEATPARIALAWVLRTEGTVAIPRTGKVAHVRDNRAALDIQLTQRDLQELASAFPAPSSRRALEML